MSKKYTNFDAYRITAAQREAYKTIGGTPHLDQNYTVYGEVIDGLQIIDSISAVQTGAFDRPAKDVRILSVRVLD